MPLNYTGKYHDFPGCGSSHISDTPPLGLRLWLGWNPKPGFNKGDPGLGTGTPPIIRSYPGETVASRPICETKHQWANSVTAVGDHAGIVSGECFFHTRSAAIMVAVVGLPLQWSDTLAEWLRRQPAKLVGSPRESSNLSGVVYFAAERFRGRVV